MIPERQVAAFIEATTPILGELVISAMHSMADQDCDLAAGDTYDDAEYRERAAAAVGAVLQHLAWSDALTGFIDSLTERADTPAEYVDLSDWNSPEDAAYDSASERADLPKATTPVDDPRSSGGNLRCSKCGHAPHEWGCLHATGECRKCGERNYDCSCSGGERADTGEPEGSILDTAGGKAYVESMGCFRCRADDHGSCHGCSCPCDRWINPRLSKCGPACVSPWSEFPLATPEPQESSNG